MEKESGKRLGGEGGLEGRGKSLFRGGGSAWGISGLGCFGGSKSPLRRLSIGLVTALSRFCRWEGNGGALFFPSNFERKQALVRFCRWMHCVFLRELGADLFQQAVDDLVDGDAFGFGAVVDEDAMAKGGFGQCLEVFLDDVSAVL